MKKILLGVALALFLGSPVFSQDQPTKLPPLRTQTPEEVVAAVVTQTGTIISFRSLEQAKPNKGDTRPNPPFTIVTAEGDQPLLLPGNSKDQDAMVASILRTCMQNRIEITLSGPLVKHTSSFGERTSLVVQRLEALVEDPALGVKQQTIITISPGTGDVQDDHDGHNH